MDTLTPQQRKRVMARNRGRTRPEKRLGSALWKRGHRYLTGDGYKARFGKALAGNPDVVFTRKRLVVFMDGCFWHGCPECGRTAKQNGVFWRRKFEKNRERDGRVTATLRGEGWAVLRVPEHTVRTKAGLEEAVRSVEAAFAQNAP